MDEKLKKKFMIMIKNKNETNLIWITKIETKTNLMAIRTLQETHAHLRHVSPSEYYKLAKLSN